MTELEATVAAAKKAVPQGISWRIATLERMRGQVDRREGGVDAEAMEAARQELVAIAPSVSNSREQTFLISNQLLNARNNEWLRRVLELLKARIQKDPNDMIARRIYMQAATMIDPASAKAMAPKRRSPRCSLSNTTPMPKPSVPIAATAKVICSAIQHRGVIGVEDAHAVARGHLHGVDQCATHGYESRHFRRCGTVETIRAA